MNFRLPPGGIIGVIGANGVGKTTLFRMIVGQETPDRGILRVGDSVVISYVDQNRDALKPENTVFQEITGGIDPIVLGKRKLPARAYVATFNFKGPDQEKKVGNLSGGERNRVHLAKLLKSGGNLLLLDEPTNDLDVDMLRRWRRRSSISAGAPWSSATIAGSSTGSPLISLPSRATAAWSGVTATISPTNSSVTSGWGPTPTNRTGSSTGL